MPTPDVSTLYCQRFPGGGAMNSRMRGRAGRLFGSGCAAVLALLPSAGLAQSATDGAAEASVIAAPADFDSLLDASIALYTAGRFDEARALIDSAKRSDLSPAALAQALNARAIVSLAMGDMAAAQASLEAALDGLKGEKAADPASLSIVESNYAVVLSRQGRTEEARAILDRLYRQRDKAEGNLAPATIASLSNLAATRWRGNEIEQVGPLYDSVIDLARAAEGGHADLLRVALLNAATIARATLQPVKGLELAREARELAPDAADIDLLGLRARIAYAAHLEGAGPDWDRNDKARDIRLEAWHAYAKPGAGRPEIGHFAPLAFVPVLIHKSHFIEAIDIVEGTEGNQFAALLRSRPPQTSSDYDIRFGEQLIGFEQRGGRESEYVNDLNAQARVLANAGKADEAARYYAAYFDRTIVAMGRYFYGKDETYDLYVQLLRSLGKPEAVAALDERLARTDASDREYNRVERLYYQDRRGPTENLALVDKLLAGLAAYPGADSHSYARALNWKAIFLAEGGRPDEAAAVLAQSLAITRRWMGPQDDNVLRQLGFYASLLQQAGRSQEAVANLRELLRLSSRSSDSNADTVSRYVEALVAAGDLATALSWADRRLAALDLTDVQTRSMEVHAEDMRARGEVPPMHFIGKSLSTEELSDKLKVLLALGKAAEAEAVGKEMVRRGDQRMKGTYDEFERHQLYGAALLANRQGEAAEAELSLAKKLLDKRPAVEPLAQMETTLLLAKARLSLPAKASSALDLVAPEMRKIGANGAVGAGVAMGGGATSIWARNATDIHLIFADASWSRGIAIAPDAASLAQADPGDAKLALLRADSFAALQSALFTPASRAVARTAAQRAAEARGPDLGRLAAEREVLLGLWAEIDAKYAAVVGGSSDEAVATRAELEQRKAELGPRLIALNDRLRAEAPDYFGLIQPEPLAIAEAQALLRPDEAMLMVVPTDFGTHVMLVTDQGIAWHRSAWTNREIDAAVRRLLWFAGSKIEADYSEIADWTAAVDGGQNGFDRDTAFALFQQVAAPVAPLMAGKRQIFVAASGSLASMPFAMLVTETPTGLDNRPDDLRATKWMGEEFALAQIPSLQSLALLRRMAPADGAAGSTEFLGFGDPELAGKAEQRSSRGAPAARSIEAGDLFGGPSAAASRGLASFDEINRMARLPGTVGELRAMADALGSGEDRLFLAGLDTEANFKAADLSRVDIITLATHGLLGGDLTGITEPGLIFTPPKQASATDDGYLTASEVSALRLGADWVILSACNTAAGDGSRGAPGLSGLARSFFYAGARNLLVSHWPVRDDVAAKLTVFAVKQTQADGSISRAEALRRAMHAIRADKAMDGIKVDGLDATWAHPNAWAPFTLIGD